MSIEDQIKQKVFKSEIEKAFVNVSYTHSYLSSLLNAAIKPHNVSLQQFNVLRILQGQYPEPVSINEITNRMVDKMSNTSRLVDKLDIKELVKRQSSSRDKRQVDVTITNRGQRILSELNKLVDSVIEEHSNLSIQEYETLNTLLDKLRMQ